jgi:hypothetical protein
MIFETLRIQALKAIFRTGEHSNNLPQPLITSNTKRDSRDTCLDAAIIRWPDHLRSNAVLDIATDDRDMTDRAAS